MRGLSVLQVMALPVLLLIVLLLSMPPLPSFRISFLNGLMCTILGTDDD